MKPLVFSLLESTSSLGENIADAINGEFVQLHQNPLRQISDAFKQGHPVVGLMASGILIRAIAPLLGDKYKDAAVIAVSPDGKHIVPLTGGHHGANQLSRQIAKSTGGKSAITTASDVTFNISLDEPPTGLLLDNPTDHKQFVAALLDGEQIKPHSNNVWLADSDMPFSNSGKLQISISHLVTKGNNQHLVYAPKTVSIGVGCERGVSDAELLELVKKCLTKANINPKSIATISTIDLKADEHAINQLAASFDVPLCLFSPDQLNQQADRLKNPSKIVMAEVGCPGVAEGAALASGGPQSDLIVAKSKSARATCAIALSKTAITTMPGRARGKLSVIGIGPGSQQWRSPQASLALTTASDWVGYDLYLDLVSDLKTGQNEHRFGLGKEEARVRHAFKLAGQGRDVALVCSGDAAIYAMAALAYEVLDTGNLTDAERRVDLQIMPGISAFQAASARAGAIIGHDFCTISLSDLLTPWKTIEQRLHAAATGDFNVAFYNPRSLKRTDQLQRAVDILTPHRASDTPVIIASNLGRPAEKVTTVQLKDFRPQDVDMLTIVLIGSSQSILISRGDGKNYCYTPRGYANKLTKNQE